MRARGRRESFLLPRDLPPELIACGRHATQAHRPHHHHDHHLRSHFGSSHFGSSGTRPSRVLLEYFYRRTQESVGWHSRSLRVVCAAMSRMLAFLMFGVSVELSCALVPFLCVLSCKGCGSVAAGLLDTNANSMATLYGGEATPSSLERRSVWTAGWIEADFMRHVSEAALPHFGRSVVVLEKVSSRVVAVLSQDGSCVRASCAAMPCCAFSVFFEELDPAFHVHGPALPAALLLDILMVLGNRNLLVAGMVEILCCT